MRMPLAVALALLAPLVLAPAPAEAHCDGITGNTHGVSNCLLQETLEDRVKQFNDATDGMLVIVLAKDRQFHPENVTIRDGGTVVWVWADGQDNRLHEPRSSVSCGTREADLAQCMPNVPQRWGECFDVLPDTGNYLGDLGSDNVVYAVTFWSAPPSGPIQKSHGLLSGTLPVPYGAAPLPEEPKTCAADTASFDDGLATIPYHCAIHGTPTVPFQMRGTVTVAPV